VDVKLQKQEPTQGKMKGYAAKSASSLMSSESREHRNLLGADLFPESWHSLSSYKYY